MKRSELSECELIVMKCVWDAGQEVTCQEIIAELNEKYELFYKDTTVYTFLKNLKTKGFVDSYRRGVTFFYAVRSEEEYMEEQLLANQKFWFNNSVAKMISALYKVNKLSAQDIQRIRKEIDELDK